MPNPSKDPHLEFEAEAARDGFEFIIGCDEVGRGAIAGPVAVGVVLQSTSIERFPDGLRDSKLLSEKKRNALAEPVAQWAVASAVGYAEAAEIDEHGITRMLAEAARRALLDLHSAGHPISESLIILDGSHDWLSPALKSPLQIRTQVKADRDCATVAAASVLAKVSRDTLMRELSVHNPSYAWESNKGYGSAAHYGAIAEHGLTEQHRKSWIEKP